MIYRLPEDSCLITGIVIWCFRLQVGGVSESPEGPTQTICSTAIIQQAQDASKPSWLNSILFEFGILLTNCEIAELVFLN